MVAKYKGKSRLRDYKEELFCQAYIDLRNGTRAAIQVGYGNTYASSAQFAKRLRQREDIIARIDYLGQKQIKELSIGKERRLEELKKIAFSSPVDYMELNKKGNDFKFIPEELKKNGGAIQEITFQGGKTPKKSIRMYDKIRALELIDKLENRDRLDKIRLDLEIESHIARTEIDTEETKIEDDGFMEAMNDIADNMDNDSFVKDKGIDDIIEEQRIEIGEKREDSKERVTIGLRVY